MASKALHIVIAVMGITAASSAAWWYQNRSVKTAGTTGSASTGSSAAAAASASASAGRPPMVEVARIEKARLMDDAQAVGTLRSRQSVMLRPEVSGRVARLEFRDGDRVRRGQLLVQLDDELPRAQVQQAQAELSIARANHKRNQELLAQNFISQRSVDESAAALQVAQAKLALAQATAGRLRIFAPFDGIAGIRNVNVGDYLKDGADIVNIEDLDAIYVDYRLPERYQTKLRRGQTAKVAIDALPGQQYTAVVQAIDPLVDANGRSVGIRGCIDNRGLELRPGMFARITAMLGQREDARVVAEEAIVPQGGRQFVYKLVEGPDQDTRIAQRVEVKVGTRQPGKVEIVEGLLQPGDMVVLAGQQRIQRDGMPVRVIDVSKAGREAASAPRDGSTANPGESAGVASSAAASGVVPPAGPGSVVAAEKPARAKPGSGSNPCVTPTAG